MRKLDRDLILHPALCNADNHAMELLDAGPLPPSVRALQSSRTGPFTLEKNKLLFEAAMFEHNLRTSKCSQAQNALMYAPLFRKTVLSPAPALVNQSHISTILFVHRALQSNPPSSKDPRLTIQSTIRPKAPNARRLPTVVKSDQQVVQALRFVTPSRNPAFVLFVLTH